MAQSTLARLRSAATSASLPALPTDGRLAALAGLLWGALWGAVARIWMRLISAEHEFTLNGTLGILLIFALFGLGQAIAATARRSARSRRRQLIARAFAVVTTLPMGLAAGAQMLPTLLLAAMALGRTHWPRALRAGLALLAALPTLLILRQLLQDLPWWRAVLGWGLMLLVYAPLVRALAGAWRPYQESAEEPGPGLPG